MNAIAIRTSARVDSSLIASRGHSLSRAGSGMKLGLLQGGLLAALSLASAACSSVNAATPPVAPVSTGAAACHAAGGTKVLARRVFVPGGVAASVQDGSFAVRFAPDSAHCTRPRRADRRAAHDEGVVLRSRRRDGPRATTRTRRCSPGSRTTVRSRTSPSAWPRTMRRAPSSGSASRETGARSRTRFTCRRRASAAGETAPALAPIGHDRFLLAWVEGDSESHQVRAQSVVGWGEPLGASMVLSPPTRASSVIPASSSRPRATGSSRTSRQSRASSTSWRRRSPAR